MKKILQLLFSVGIVVSGFSQNLKPIAQKVADQKLQNRGFVKFSPFTKDVASKNANVYNNEASDVTVMQLKSSELQTIVNEKPQAMELTFPFEGRELTVELVKNNILTNDFQVETDKGVKAYTPGVYYQGIIKGDNTSVVAFSFFDNDVVGVASTNELGNVVLGKARNSQDFVSYSDYKLKPKNPFTCGAEELPENQTQNISFDPSKKTSKLTVNCIRIYFEVGNNLYTRNGSNVTTTTNWVTALFNNIKTLYDNENVNVAMSSIYVWSTTDPYPSVSSTVQPGDVLSAFRSGRPTFNGDLAQLLKYPDTTSVAYVNSLCTTNKYSFCGLNLQSIAVPTYSWNIEAMTHELGHSLGSPHTHACAWNGNNTAIDGCGPASGNNEGCNGPLPTTTKGTIMSYCHLVSSVGISFANGFGPQPGDLIRQIIDSKACMSGDCSKSCDVTVSAITVATSGETSATVTVTDNTSTSWKYRVSSMDGTIVKSGISSSKVFNISDLATNVFYKIEVGTDCSPLYQKSQVILTGDNWCGKVITDTGGETGNYSNNENWTKTFYPNDPSQKLKISFTDFNINAGDYIVVRNGLSSGVPFQGTISGNTLPPDFESTHATGAITITFRSGTGATASGFKANFTCSALAVNDVTNSKDISLSPNPVKNQFTLKGIAKIAAVEIYDVSGKLVKQFDGESLSKNTFDVSKLKTGNYVVKIKTANDSFSKNLIKQ